MFLSVFLCASAAFAEGLRNLPPATEPRIEVTDRVWATTPGEASVCIWKDDALAAVTFTIDDNSAPDHDWWLEMAEKYGIKITWFVVVDAITEDDQSYFGTWEKFRRLYAAGHDIQSHTVTHRGPKKNMPVEQDYADSIAPIEENVKGVKCLTLAFPGGGLPNDPDIAAKYFIAARGTSGHFNAAATVNYQNTNSISGLFEMDNPKHWAHFPGVIDPSHKLFRCWASTHYHGVKDEMKPNVVRILEFIKEHKDDLWCGTFRNVAQYGQQRDTATLKVTKNTATEIALDLTSKMDPEYFDYPLTVKVCVPKNWKKVAATQAGKEIEYKLVEHEGNKYVLAQIVPGRGEALLKAE